MKQRPNLKQYLRKLFSALAIAGTLLGLPSADAATITVTRNAAAPVHCAGAASVVTITKTAINF